MVTSKKNIILITILIILCIPAIISFTKTTDEIKSARELFDSELASLKETVIEDGYLKYRGAEWDDIYNGLELAVHSVSLTTDNQSGFGVALVWMSLDNKSDKEFTSTLRNPSSGQGVVVNSTLGGVIKPQEFRDGDFEISLFDNNINELKRLSFSFDVTDKSTLETKTFDVILDLK